MLPPLRNRKECLPLLINHFLLFYCEKHGRRIQSVSDKALNVLLNYSWPGNVRELRHIIERGCVLCEGPNLLIENLPEELVSLGTSHHEDVISEPQDLTTNSMDVSMFEVGLSERNTLIAALKQTRGNKSKAAKLLSIDRSTLYRKLKKLDIIINGR